MENGANPTKISPKNLKIFLSFLQSKVQHPIAAYSFWEYYLKNGLTEGGYEWEECEDVDWAEGLVPKGEAELNKWKSVAWEKTLEHIKQSRPAIFLSYLYPHQVDEQAILAIKKMGIYCVNFFCDHIREYKQLPDAFSVFDLNWVPEHKAMPMYKKAGFNAMNLPMPMWVQPKHRIITKTENEQLSFIGSLDIQRLLLFEELAKTTFQFEIYGAGWLNEEDKKLTTPLPYSLTKKIAFQLRFLERYGLKAYLRKTQQSHQKKLASEILKGHVHGKINFEKYIDISQNSMITLGVNRYPSFEYPLHQPNSYSRLRDIEAPMLGACYLAESTFGLSDLYEIGSAIEVYENAYELMDKANWLKKNPNHRSKLRKNAQAVALNEHSISNSISKIIQYLNK